MIALIEEVDIVLLGSALKANHSFIILRDNGEMGGLDRFSSRLIKVLIKTLYSSFITLILASIFRTKLSFSLLGRVMPIFLFSQSISGITILGC